MPALPGDAHPAAAETLEWQDRRKDTWQGSETTTHELHCKSGHQDGILAWHDRHMFRKLWEGKTHGWINAALSRKPANVEGHASFENDGQFKFTRCIRPGADEAPTLWVQLEGKTKENSSCRDPRQKSSNLQNSVTACRTQKSICSSWRKTSLMMPTNGIWNRNL